MKEVEERVQISGRWGEGGQSCSRLCPLSLGSQKETNRLSVAGLRLGKLQARSSGEVTLENGGSIVYLYLGKYGQLLPIAPLPWYCVVNTWKCPLCMNSIFVFLC